MTKHQSIDTRRRLTATLATRTRTDRGARGKEVALASVARGRNDPLPDLAMAYRQVGELKPAARKVREIDSDHIAELARVISAFGFAVPLLISGDGKVVDGHTRLEAAKALGLEAVPCIVIDHLSETEQVALKIAVNRLGEKGSWDLDALKLEMITIDDADIDLSLTGFSLPEIDIIIALEGDDVTGNEADRAEPVATGPAISRLGDLWQLGPHRLLVGDSTDPESYALLMAGASAACVFTDPLWIGVEKGPR